MIFSKRNHSTILLSLGCVVAYFIFAYFLERTEFYKLLLLWVGLFAGSYFLIKKQQHHLALLAVISILFKLVFLFAIPNLLKRQGK